MQPDIAAVVVLVVLILVAIWLALSGRGQKQHEALPGAGPRHERQTRFAGGNAETMNLVMTRMLEQFEQLEKRMVVLDSSLERLGSDMSHIKGEVAQISSGHARQAVSIAGTLLPPNATPEQVVTVAHRLAEEGLPAKEIAPMMNISRNEAELLLFLRDAVEKKSRERAQQAPVN